MLRPPVDWYVGKTATIIDGVGKGMTGKITDVRTSGFGYLWLRVLIGDEPLWVDVNKIKVL